MLGFDGLESRCLLAVTFNEFPIPTFNSGPRDITTGPDGNLWFTEQLVNTIGRITTAGTITEFVIPSGNANSTPWGITAGPDGNLWFTERLGNTIGRITPAGTITEFAVLTANSSPWGLTTGPDGALWFTEQTGDKIGRITTAGVLTNEFVVPTANGRPEGITLGPDGNLWFTENQGSKIGRITPAGIITEFPLPQPLSGPRVITVGPDGNLWFTEENTNQIGRITPTGTITEFAVPTAGSHPNGITTGPDGNLWFTELNQDKIGRITPTGTITEFATPRPAVAPLGITLGPDGNLWFTEEFRDGNAIGRIQVSSLATTTTQLTSSPNPSAVGHPVLFTAIVTKAAGSTGTPTGTVRFLEGTAVLGTVPLGAAGRATLTTAALGAGPHTVTAVYSGDAAFAASTGTTVQTVRAASQATTTTVVASSPNPSAVGHPVLFTAIVTKAAGSTGTPTGTVRFLEGTAVLGTVPLGAAGRATLTTAALGAGPHTVTAVYSGDAAFAASTGTTVQVVNAAAGRPPRVVNLQRFGIHAQPTVLVLIFDRPLNAATAQDARNYQITGAGGHSIGLRSVSYDPAMQTVTLLPSRRLDIHRRFRLTVIGSGLTGVMGADGKLLDGSGAGQPGTNYRAVIDRATLVLPTATARLAKHPHGPLPVQRHGLWLHSTHGRPGAISPPPLP